MRVHELALFLTLALPAATAAQPVLRGLGVPDGGSFSQTRGLSADGLVVVGDADFAGASRAFRWTEATGFVDLGTLPGHDASVAFDASADGSVIVGASLLGLDGSTAFIWDAVAGMTELLPAAAATAVSDDGSVVVGSLNGGTAFRWTQTGGVELIGTLHEPGITTPWAVSADGLVVVGDSQLSIAPATISAFRWDASTGMEDLGSLPGDPAFARAQAVSADGSVITGWSGELLRAFRWTRAGGMEPVVDSARFTMGWGASGEGGVLVGRGHDGVASQAVAWSNGTLIDLGTPACAGADAETPSEARAVSADGTVVAGIYWPGLEPEAFIATIGKGCNGPIGDLAPGVLDDSTNPPTWHVVGDGALTVGDVVALLRAVVEVQTLSCEP